ncbi:thioesterase-like superfamily protein [Mycolicibacterium hassiacum DSM 44199]|uniref:Thioesterase-like superfamily protein n=1 Tax=Mycolicibacterium hassiacum (strain DSM 44199 / CIP 105218 / JCM 12690 / 3849) TaxID=1122247 RepID=K5BHP4_MYCHD|nr:acyl-CoA thioesterase domain-containing protein [Mycolicibacterium hassiacum]EKF25041.1 thioesterase-like superfamily protein [Mycolicibacterium hassiacum DSM 44199]MBX5485976.1 thioesterase family protein [Mycolicibacterium hassiacum]MDA4087949.1 choloyl-CoA hydrolase [Mycolicibacterium hassiacum DSM 44199]PZN21311.1 MAG: acyl-CoA thioesterase II [Mycolicibacterium hassiacum]VCT93239.1 Acyl-CoA thioesterase 2 [Mycolicibacterium hassiacum DSM 44199]
MTPAARPSREVFDAEQAVPTSVADLLRLHPLPHDRFRADPAGTTGGRAIYGGQVAAQALRAAGLTVPDDRITHSLHAYFLTAGDAGRPIELRVERGRDGGRYSSRRVSAIQDDTLIFSMLCSFVRASAGAPEFQPTPMPPAEPPGELVTHQLNASRTFDVEAKVPTDSEPWYRWPARLWLRIREPLPDDPNARACGVVFLSDLCTGLSRAPHIEQVGLLPSIDHAVWLHRGGDPNQWLLIDLHPQSTSGGRGMYTGQIFDADGTLLASLAQECLFDFPRKK